MLERGIRTSETNPARARRPSVQNRSYALLAVAVALHVGCRGVAQTQASKTAPATSQAETPKTLPAVLNGPVVPLPPAASRVDVPGFGGATQWLNVERPLSLADLRGRVVVVDFWTSCCINCLQTFPTLKKLEDEFRDQPFVVVGVHSPKFDEEGDAERLIDIVLDNRIEHPVASDPGMTVWRGWGVEAWPTVAVLDVNGKALWAGAGEPDPEEISNVVRSALREGFEAGTLAKGPLPGARPEKDTSGALRYPSKVVGLADGGMAVADTGHDRIVIVDKEGKVTDVVGSGASGKKDGSFAEASFSRPAGIAEVAGALFVADTSNHALRKVDRNTKRVTTVAGTGGLGERLRDNVPRPGLSVALRSPWDVVAVGEEIFVALAGSHQIGLFNATNGQIRLFAGSGREARMDGELLDAAFAQPSGLAFDPAKKELYVLDSETSSVRAIDVRKGSVRTIVGKDLFVFGDTDGDRETARFQHPIGLALSDGVLYVADSYNSKVKQVDPQTGATKTLLGGRDDKLLGEPAGLTVIGSDLVIADTNHHRLVRIAKKGTGIFEPITLRNVAP